MKTNAKEAKMKSYIVVEYSDDDTAPLNVIEVFNDIIEAENYVAEFVKSFSEQDISKKRIGIVEEKHPNIKAN